MSDCSIQQSFLKVYWTKPKLILKHQLYFQRLHRWITVIIIIIPVVVGVLGTVKKGKVENIKKVSERATVTEIQKICMLGSARILRKVLII